MSVSYNSTSFDSIDSVTEDAFVYIVQPKQIYNRTNQTRSRGVLREDSFLRIASTRVEAEAIKLYLEDVYGVESQIVPISIRFAPDAQVSLSLRRLSDIESGEPDLGDLIQYTGQRIDINGVDSPKYNFGRIDTQYVDEHPSNLYYTDGKVSDYIASATLDTITPSEGDNSTKIATTQYTDRAIASLIDSAPSTLDTLNELAAAINDDSDFHTTILGTTAALQSELNATQLGSGLTFSGAYAEDSSSNYIQTASSLRGADSLLDSAIFAIQNELDATQIGAGLDTDGSYIAKTDANYIDEAVSLQDADEKLDAQSKVNADAIATETTARQNADSALQTELDTTQSGAGLTGSGQYVANSSSTHLTASTSLKDADNKLDAALVQESSTRASADTTLQTNIDSEASTRASADTTLQTNIDSEASTRASADTALDTRIDNLHAVASSGSYDDLNNKPSLFSGNYSDLSSKPSLFSGSYNDLSNKPSLFSGSYNDLTDVPSGTDLSGYATETYVDTAVSNLVDSAPSALNTLNELAAALGDDSNFSTTITNSLALKANTSDIFSGDYNDLDNKPSIPSAYTLPTAAAGVLGGIRIGYSQNNKNYPVILDGSNKAYVNVPWVSSTGGGFSGDYNDLDNKPTIPSLTGYATQTYVDNAVFSGDYDDLDNKPSIPSAYTLPTAGPGTLGGITTNYSTNVASQNYAVQMSGTNAYVNVPVPAATSQDLGGVKVSFSNGNLYISTS